ncbi:MAG: hypothetical protein D3924_19095, partial [Candidatus Electrothrix sp. AR4]|nr:hypothetical protein [Candidatus Electrothrix sp. AR4]
MIETGWAKGGPVLTRENAMTYEIKWEFNQLPCRYEERGSKFQGILSMVLIIFLGGLPTFLSIKSILNGEFVIGMVLMLFFTVPSIGIFLGSLFELSLLRVTEFDGEIFRYRSKSLFHSKAWDEPLSGYKAVLARSADYSGIDSLPNTLYIIELMHPNFSDKHDSQHLPLMHN